MLCGLFVFLYFIVFFFIVMLNVGYYFFAFLLSWISSWTFNMCLCAPLCLTCFVGKGFQHIKKWYVIQRDHTSAVFYCGVLRESKGSPSHERIGGAMVITVTVVITESQPRLVTASRHPPFLRLCVFFPSIMAPVQHT